MTQTITLTANNALVLPESILARYKTNKFSVIVHDDSIFIEPTRAADDDEKYYELTPEGENSLQKSIIEARNGQLRPVKTLFD